MPITYGIYKPLYIYIYSFNQKKYDKVAHGDKGEDIGLKISHAIIDVSGDDILSAGGEIQFNGKIR